MNRTERFTVDGDAALEGHLADICGRVLEGLRSRIPAKELEAVLLGGGYGRGEGGVRHTALGDAPYNDLEFYVMIRGAVLLGERKLRGKLAKLGHELSTRAGVEVEFKVLSFEKLRRSGPSMFYYDLVVGHRWILGDEHLLEGCEHHRDPTQIPIHEAARLLMNRCSGLLFSAERLARSHFGAAEVDFVGRNLAKAELALGDVVLTAYGQYHQSCRWRHERLHTLAGNLPLPWIRAVLDHHRAGVEFKLHPVNSVEPKAVLRRRHGELCSLALPVWLWLEGLRLNQHFNSPADYAASRLDLCPERRRWKNVLLNLGTFGWPTHFLMVGRYPRERLLRSLPLLLWEADNGRHRADVQRLLRGRSAEWPDLVQRYGEVWQRFN